MGKIKLIISREYITRVRKKSFIIMTILGPVLFAAFMVLPVIFSTMEDKDEKTVDDIISISAGFASPTEIRECLRLLFNREMLEVERRGLGGAYYYRLPKGKKQITCPWCLAVFTI